MVGGMAELDPAALSGVLERLVTVVRRLPAPGDLSLATAATLNTLSRFGPARLGELARRENITQPGMTQLVVRLERAGLAERRVDPADGRATVVAITAAGEDLLDGRRRARAEQITTYVDVLPAADRRRLAAALPALAELAERGERDWRARADRPATVLV